MNKKIKEALISKLVVIAEQAKQQTIPGNRFRIIDCEGVVIILSDEQLDNYTDIVRTILKNADWVTKFSEDYVDNSLKTTLVNAVKNNDQKEIEKFFDDFFLNLQTYSTRHKILVPILGITMDRDVYEIGNVVLRKMTKEKTDELFSSFEKIVLSSNDTPEKKAAQIDRIRNITKERISNHTCSEFEAIAEPLRAKERAIEETRRVLDLFYYAIPSLYTKNVRVHIGLVGDIFRSERWIPVLSSDQKRFTLTEDIVGPLGTFEISQHHLDHMENIGVIKISSLLKKTYPLNSYEESLLRAIHWYAISQKQNELENQLLNLITALETLLTPKDNSPIQKSIAEGVAFLMGRSVENRIKLNKRIKEFYGLRCALSHGGKKNILEADLDELQLIVGNLIMVMINKLEDFKSQEDLLNWIEKEKFT